MGVVNLTGNSTGNQTIDISVDTPTITGAYNQEVGHTLTFDIAAATKQSDINDIENSGQFAFSFNGGTIVSDGGFKVRPTWLATNANTDMAEYIFNIKAVGAASSITFNILKHISTLNITAAYVADNLTWDKNILDECSGDPFSYAAGVATTFGDMEIKRHRNTARTFGLLLLNSTNNLTMGRVIFRDIYKAGNLIYQGNSMTCNITMLMCIDASSTTDQGVISRAGSTPVINVTKAYMYRSNSLNFVRDYAAGTCNIDGGVVYAHRACRGSLNVLFTMDDIDFYGTAASNVDAGAGGNFKNCLVAGFALSSVPTPWSTADANSGGTVDGIADVSAGMYGNSDSVITPKSIGSENFPFSYSGALALTSAVDGRLTATWTGDHPGKTWIYVSKSEFTALDTVEDLEANSLTKFGPFYHEWIDYSGDGKLQDDVGERTININDSLQLGETYHAVAYTENEQGVGYISANDSQEIQGSAGGVGSRAQIICS